VPLLDATLLALPWGDEQRGAWLASVASSDPLPPALLCRVSHQHSHNDNNSMKLERYEVVPPNIQTEIIAKTKVAA
jgi:hypothetical protein